jgi:sugar phosphate isomerase/epimerase
VEVSQAEGAQDVERQVERVADLVADLVRAAEDVGVVLGEAAHAGQAVSTPLRS